MLLSGPIVLRWWLVVWKEAAAMAATIERRGVGRDVQAEVHEAVNQDAGYAEQGCPAWRLAPGPAWGRALCAFSCDEGNLRNGVALLPL